MRKVIGLFIFWAILSGASAVEYGPCARMNQYLVQQAQ